MSTRALLRDDVVRLRQLGRDWNVGPVKILAALASLAVIAWATQQALVRLQDTQDVVQWCVLHAAGLLVFLAVGLATLRWADRSTATGSARAEPLGTASVAGWATARASVAHFVAGFFVGAPLLLDARIDGDVMLWTAWSTGSFSGTAVTLAAAFAPKVLGRSGPGEGRR
jgi:hypothetical protein